MAKWSPAEIELLRQLMKAGHSHRSAGQVLKRSYSSIRSKCRNEGIESRVDPRTGQMPDFEGPPEVPIYDRFMRLEGDRIVCCDVHAPCVDWLMATRLALIARKYLEPPRHLLIGGDFLNYDAFSKYDDLAVLPSFRQELEAAVFALKLWRQTFDRIELFFGNHDYRWLKTMADVYPEDTIIDMFLAMVGNPNYLTVSVYPYAEVMTETGLWEFSHGEYAQTPLFKARKLANTAKDRHVGTAHQHHLAKGLDESGKYLLCDMPMLGDPDKLAYVGLFRSTKPRMKRGFGMLYRGAMYLFSDNPAWTDWRFWLDD